MHKEYNFKCDVFSYGMLLWEILHRRIPFYGFTPVQAAFQVAVEGGRPPIALSQSMSMYIPLITACWAADPGLRPDLEAVALTAQQLQLRVVPSSPESVIDGPRVSPDKLSQPWSQRTSPFAPPSSGSPPTPLVRARTASDPVIVRGFTVPVRL